MRERLLRIAVTAIFLLPAPLTADILRLRNGKEVEGTFLGATARQVEFLPSSGQAIKIALDSVITDHCHDNITTSATRMISSIESLRAHPGSSDS